MKSPTHKVTPEIKGFHSPDIFEWNEGGRPDNSFRFSILLQISIGESGSNWSDIFNIMIKASPDRAVIGAEFREKEHTLFVDYFDRSEIEQVIRGYVTSCSGATWEEVAQKISTVAKWEFDNYQPYEEASQ